MAFYEQQHYSSYNQPQQHQQRQYYQQQNRSRQGPSRLESFEALPAVVLKLIPELSPSGRKPIISLRKAREVVEVLKRLTEGVGDRLVMTVQRGTRPTDWRPDALGVQTVSIDNSCLGAKWFSLGDLGSNGDYLTPREQGQLRAKGNVEGGTSVVGAAEVAAAEGDEDIGVEEGEVGGGEEEVQGAAADVEDILSCVMTPWVKQELYRWLDRARQMLKVRAGRLTEGDRQSESCANNSCVVLQHVVEGWDP